MCKKYICFLLLLTISFAGTLIGQEIPTSDEARRVVEYYHSENDNSVILTDSKICKGIHREGIQKNECNYEIIEFGKTKADDKVPDVVHKIEKGESVYIWMSYLVPLGSEEEIFLRFNFKGATMRTSSKAKVKGSFRYRTWRKFTPSAIGNWEIEIFHQATPKPVKLNSFVLTVE